MGLVQRPARDEGRAALARGHDRHAHALPRHRADRAAEQLARRLPASTSRTSASSRSAARRSRGRSRSSPCSRSRFAVTLHATPVGRAIFAIGSNQEAAYFSGIRVKRIKLGLFVLSGLFCAIAGILFSLRFASARYDAGTGLELNAVLIVLLGGISIFGGRGTMLGLVLAMCVIAALQSGLTLAPDVAAGPERRHRRAARRERDPAERLVDLRPCAHAPRERRGAPGEPPRRRRRRARS